MMIWILIGAAVFTADWLIKRWAEQKLKGKGKCPIGKTGFSLQLVHNKGFAGSRMKEKPELVKIVHAFVLVFLGMFYVLAGYFKKENGWTGFGLSLIFGGGASNLYDRIQKGYVTDYLGLPIAKKLVFNISDLCIFVGTFLMLLGEIKGAIAK